MNGGCFYRGLLIVAMHAHLCAAVCLPGVLAAKAAVMVFAHFHAGKRTARAGAFGMEPVAVGIKLVFDKIWVNRNIVGRRELLAGVPPGVALHTE